MRKGYVLLLMGVLGMLLWAAGAWGQGPERASGPEGWPLGQMYNPKTVERLDGRVEAVERLTAGRMDIPARVLVRLKTDQESITIYLGPEWYFEQQGLKLAQGDYIQVRGSRITVDQKPLILPNEVIKNQKVAKFWDDQGRPLWRGPAGKGPQK